MKVQRRNLVLDPEVMLRMVKLSGSGMLQAFIGTASWIAMVRVISDFGSDAVAGYTIGMRVILFALFLRSASPTPPPRWSVSPSVPTSPSARKAVWIAGLDNAVFLCGMGILFLIWAPTIIGWFSGRSGRWGLRRSLPADRDCGFLFYAFGMVLTQAFNGAGDTWTPTVINLFIFWVFEIPAAYVLSSVLQLGPQGVFLAVTLAFRGSRSCPPSSSGKVGGRRSRFERPIVGFFVTGRQARAASTCALVAVQPTMPPCAAPSPASPA